jgi:hypothetical protein
MVRKNAVIKSARRPRRSARKSVRRSRRKSVRRPRRSARKSVRRSARKSVRRSARKSVRRPRRSARKSVRRPRRSARKSVRRRASFGVTGQGEEEPTNIGIISWNIEGSVVGESMGITQMVTRFVEQTRGESYDAVVIGFQEAGGVSASYTGGESCRFLKTSPVMRNLQEVIKGEGELQVYCVNLQGFGAEGYRGLVTAVVYRTDTDISFSEPNHTRCHVGDQKAGKGIIGVSATLRNQRWMFANAHLPFITDRDRQGYQARVNCFQKAVERLNFSDYDYVSFSGDLNFRVEGGYSEETLKSGNYKEMAAHDQLTEYLQTIGQGWVEGDLEFPPTCKLLKKRPTNCYEFPEENPSECYQTSSKGSPRIPSWCDRILVTTMNMSLRPRVEIYRNLVIAYLKGQKISDHDPVIASISAPWEAV